MRQTALLFLKLGFLAFGGPSAHVAMLEDEVVERRSWMSRQHFLDLVGATNLIPGPNSTQMMMHVGWERHGLPGLLAAGGLFILPAALLTGICAWAYVAYGQLPMIEPLLFGIKPAILAVILVAIWRLGRKAVKDWRFLLLGVAVATAVWVGVDELLALFVGAVVGALWFRFSSRDSRPAAGTRARSIWPVAGIAWRQIVSASATPVTVAASGTAAVAAVASGPTLESLGLFFLKVGSILYGSGYVLIAFIEGDLVQQLGWLTGDQLLDAVAIGQFTPGPILSTATFVGYLLLGVPGAVVSTVAIFLPSFVLVPILNPLIPRMRRNPWASAFLDGINVSAVALMAAIMGRLALSTLTTWQAGLIAVLSVVAVLRFKVHSLWLVIGGALLGYLLATTT